MSMYNLICQVNPAAGALLAAVELEWKSIPRFRDIWINKEYTEVTVYTRTGGGNREAFEEGNAYLQTHPLYTKDEDDKFDSTYASFTFRLPPEKTTQFKEQLELALESQPKEVQESFINAITESAREKTDKVLKKVESDININRALRRKGF